MNVHLRTIRSLARFLYPTPFAFPLPVPVLSKAEGYGEGARGLG